MNKEYKQKNTEKYKWLLNKKIFNLSQDANVNENITKMRFF